MAKLLNYMVVHKDPDISWDKIEENLPRLKKLPGYEPASIKKRVCAIVFGWRRQKKY